MEITNINITPISPNKGLIAFATIIIDGVLEVSSIGIYTKLEGGIRLTFPARKLGSGQYKYYVRPLGKEIEQKITEAVSEKINKLGLFNFSRSKSSFKNEE